MNDEKAAATLRPCPFCGSKHVEAFTAPMGTHGVRCYSCGADVMFYGAEGSEEKAIAAWNRRAIPPTATDTDELPPKWADAPTLELGA